MCAKATLGLDIVEKTVEVTEERAPLRVRDREAPCGVLECSKRGVGVLERPLELAEHEVLETHRRPVFRVHVCHIARESKNA